MCVKEKIKSKIALFADARVKGRQIDVETTNGQVMPRGEVDSNAARQAEEDITKGRDGVKSAQNALEVVVPSTREAVVKKEEAITERVQTQIAKDSDPKNSDIGVQTNASIVSLTGEGFDFMESPKYPGQPGKSRAGKERSHRGRKG